MLRTKSSTKVIRRQCKLRRKVQFPQHHLVKEHKDPKIKCLADVFVVHFTILPAEMWIRFDFGSTQLNSIQFWSIQFNSINSRFPWAGCIISLRCGRINCLMNSNFRIRISDFEYSYILNVPIRYIEKSNWLCSSCVCMYIGTRTWDLQNQSAFLLNFVMRLETSMLISWR